MRQIVRSVGVTSDLRPRLLDPSVRRVRRVIQCHNRLAPPNTTVGYTTRRIPAVRTLSSDITSAVAGSAPACGGSLLVQVEQVPAAVFEHGVDAPVAERPGLGHEHHPAVA
jgi:hypothetical protein